MSGGVSNETQNIRNIFQLSYRFNFKHQLHKLDNVSTIKQKATKFTIHYSSKF